MKGFSVSASEMVAPPKPEIGDVAVPFFRLAKTRGASPAALAQQAAEALAGSRDLVIATAEAAGPYLNVRFSDATLSSAVTDLLATESLSSQAWRAAVSQAEAGTYGRLASTGQAPILFEYANPNTHKEIHIGHLRNFVTGVAYHSIWDAAGIPVIAIQFINDQGANVAKALWALVRIYSRKQSGRKVLGSHGYEVVFDIQQDDISYLASNGDPINELKHKYYETCIQSSAVFPMARELGRIYAEAASLLEERGEKGKEEISLIQAKLEERDVVWTSLWEQTREACIDEIRQICDEMEIVFHRSEPYLESAFLEQSAAIVDRLEADGVATKSEGALIVDLEQDKLGVCLLRKSDGNLLYLSKDLALAEQKKNDYPNAGASFVLTDDRQALHFRQLNAVLQKMGYGRPYQHLGYGLLTLKEGAMSSRKGNIITYQWLRDALIAHATLQVSERHKDDAAWDVSRVNRVAHDIAFGGMKFALLKQDPKSVFLFDQEQALSFEGMTGPYCQYAFVRLFSILEKAGGAWEGGSEASESLTPAERSLILALATLPDVVSRAAGRVQGNVDVQQTQPALLAQWCFTTAQAVNAFYRDTPVLDVPPALRARRLDLALAAACALRNGLRILTIPVPTAM